MSSTQLLFLIYLSFLSSSVVALPITSIPLKSSPEHLTWDAAYEPKLPSQYVVAKKITPKSIFITPNFNNLSSVFCAQGWKLDASGQCIQIVTINQADILVSRLQSILSQTTKSNGDDYYDYEASEESPGPLQFDLFGLGVPQQLKGDSANAHHKVAIPLPPTTSTTTTTTTTTTSKTPDTTLSTTTPKSTTTTTTSDLFSSPSQRFEFINEEYSSTVLGTSTTPKSTTAAETTTAQPPTTSRLNNELTRQSTLTNEPELTSQSQLFLASQSDANRANVDPTDMETVSTTMEFSTTMSDSPTSSSSAASSAELYESTDAFEDSTASRVHPTDNAEDLALLNSSLNDDLKADFLIFDNGEEEIQSTMIPSTTEFEQEELSTTVLFNTEESTEPRLPSSPTSFAVPTSTQQDTVSSASVFIVTPQRISTTFLPTSTSMPRTTTVSETEDLKYGDDKELLRIENDTRQSEQLRATVMKHEMKANNMERLEANNRFVYHHLTAATDQPRPVSTTEKTVDNNTFERRQLQPKTDSTELKRNRIRFPYPSAQPFQSRSDMIRFPGPVANRQSSVTAPSINHLAIDELDGRKISTSEPPPLKPNWWLPAGWEVDRTTGSQKPLLLRFWSRMPLIRDPSLSFRNNDRDRNLRHRENSKSPRDNFYKEIASQDIYKVFESNKHSRHYNHR